MQFPNSFCLYCRRQSSSFLVVQVRYKGVGRGDKIDIKKINLNRASKT